MAANSVNYQPNDPNEKTTFTYWGEEIDISTTADLLDAIGAANGVAGARQEQTPTPTPTSEDE